MLAEPAVVTDEGLLLDGRNRLLASWDAQLDVRIVRLNPPSPLQYVLSGNVHRRHLNTGQKAMVALAALPIAEAEAAQRMMAGKADPGADRPQGPERAPQARDHAAALVGANGRNVMTHPGIAPKFPGKKSSTREGV